MGAGGALSQFSDSLMKYMLGQGLVPRAPVPKLQIVLTAKDFYNSPGAKSPAKVM